MRIRKHRADSGSASTSTREISAHLIYFPSFQTNFLCLKKDFIAKNICFENSHSVHFFSHVRKEVNKDHENLGLIPGCRISDGPSQDYGQPWALSHVQSKHCLQTAEGMLLTDTSLSSFRNVPRAVWVNTLLELPAVLGGRLTDEVVIFTLVLNIFKILNLERPGTGKKPEPC